MPVISIAIQKGGSGKTTTVVNLAAALHQLGYRVLVIDTDPQANLTASMGVSEDSEPNLYHLFRQAADGKEPDVAKAIVKSKSGLDILPASLELAAAEMELVSVYGREQLLGQMLEQLRGVYDFIMIDCPPSIGMLTVNALVASDYVLMPMQAEFLPLKGLRSFMRSFETAKTRLNRKLEMLGIILTRYDDRKEMHQRIRRDLTAEFGDIVFKTTIRTNIALAKAQEKGLDVLTFDGSSNGAMDYLQLTNEFLFKIKPS
jgi:chromosome partitioning protein